MSGKHIIAVGHAALDYVYRIEAFPTSPTKVRALEHVASGGGMAANAASAIARLGGDVALWARIGDDPSGSIIRQQLEAAGVGTAHVRTCRGVSSATAAVIVDARGERLVISEDDHDFPLPADWLPIDDVRLAKAVLSDLTWLEGTLAAFTAARSHAIPTVLDVDLNSGQLLAKVLPLADYAIFSAPAFRLFVKGESDEARLEALLQSGIRHAGVTKGAEGYLWMNRAGERGREPAFPVNVVDTTGAGDAFHGAFTWAVAEGLKDADCARIASAVAAMSCRGLGARAGLPARDDVSRFLAGMAAGTF
ncbi:PfkB family carbohydrate kinase [Hyphomicrobium sp.]|uniref:PfkB family carbohydrate kinase n=1 Tax=Hyphomicrobium sp. TaxID=82 RepID=UPI002D78A931|nr:PfkB family carbohydrate kinase [Hyphomicrobium sp.]HET6389602.1 PfkB family carbohydrate kinase [Hyphomicrobium sp.]